MVKRMSFNSKLLQGISAVLFSAVSLAAVLWLFSPGNKGSIIPLTDHNAPEETESEDKPNYIFIEKEPASSLNADEILSQIKVTSDATVINVTDTALLSSKKVSLPGAGRLSAEGYYTSNLSYEGSSFVIAKMTPEFALPESFSLRNKTIQTVEHKQLSDYSQFSAVYTDKEVERPGIELYMGYFFVDNGSTIDIYSSAGKYLMSFDDTQYIPAYTRDSSGRPLFYKIAKVDSGLFDEEGLIRDEDGGREREPHEKEETVLVTGKLEKEGEGNPVKEEIKVYYSLSYNGSYFAASDYEDITDGRGLYFNYPAYYGISDSNITLSAKTFNEYKQNIDGVLSLKHDSKWTYRKYGITITEEVFDRAYNFKGGLGCVVTEGYYQDGGLFFLNASGNRAFNTLKKYNDTNADRYVIVNYMPPISTGSESIGYFYYDNGLVRARREVIDYWNYDDNNRIQVYSSEEVLLNTKGEVFPTPKGYNVKAYSNGMILLEKGGVYGFMDYTGAWVAEPIFKYAEAFYEGLAVLVTADGRYGMIDTEGNIVLPFTYDYISSCSDGLIVAYSDDAGWEIMRKMTK